MKLVFSEDFIKQVKDSNDIIEVAQDYFNLIKSGDLYKAHCKHRGGDKTPSLTFFPSTQSFYCFACKAGERNERTNGSDVISFIQWVENIEWQDAVILLAKRIGLEIPKAELSKEEREKLALYDKAMEKNRQYWRSLMKDENVLKWFESRGITKEDITKWRLGVKDGVPVYAIIDEYGRTVGFSYRMDNDSGKYVNSKNSDIFKKGNVLYGLNYIKKEIRQNNFIVIVEGYNDVIALQKYGVPAAGIMGTAITQEQMNLIRKYTTNVILFLDGDTAGIESTIDNIKLLKAEGFEVDVLNICGFDPDDLAHKQKENTLKFIIENKKLAFQFLINNVLDKYFDNMLRLKKETMKNLNEILNYIENEEERRLYRDQLIKIISLEERDYEKS